ncbi:MAG: hypothetical protein AB7G28_26080 [Pirellulales bacterium]
MWRSLSFLLTLTLLPCPKAVAEVIELSGSSFFVVHEPLAIDFGLVFGHFDDATGSFSELARASMNNVRPSSQIQHVEFYASTALEQGLDWDEVLAWGRQMGHNTWRDWPFRLAVVKDGDLTPPLGLDPRSPDYAYDELRFANYEIEAISLNVYDYKPSKGIVFLFWHIVGNGNVVPEPNTLAMATAVIVFWSTAARRRCFV